MAVSIHKKPWEERPYGRRLVLEPFKRQLVQIDPGQSTAAGVPREELKEGLRGHPDVHFEHVTHLGNTLHDDDPADEPTLMYAFLDRDGKVQPQYFTVGSRFYSVQMDIGPEGQNNIPTGYWHALVNRTDDRTILLEIESG